MATDPTNRKKWYKTGAMGKNKLGDLMKDIAKEVGLEGKFCNHTVRTTLVTNLLQSGVPPTLIKDITGHKNIQSISNYASASKAQIKKMNDILLDPSGNIPKDGQIPCHKPALTAKKMPNPIENMPNSSNNETSVSGMRPEKIPHSSPLEKMPDSTNNQTALSGLLHNSSLSNCTFNFSYTIHEK